MSKKTKVFDKITLPENRGQITVRDVLVTPEGLQRDEMIHNWCKSVWDAYSNEHNKVIEMTTNLLQK
jgi:hypothetical protein